MIDEGGANELRRIGGLEVRDLVVGPHRSDGGPPARIARLAVPRGRQACHVCGRDDGRALLRALAGLDPAAHGVILVDGTEVDGRSVFERRIAVIPEDGGLLPHLTVRQNILYGTAAGIGATAAVIRGILPGLQADLQLVPAQDRRPEQLGTRELHLRVALARAAISEPGAIAIHLPEPPEIPDRLPSILASAVVRRARPPAVLILTDVPGLVELLSDAGSRAPGESGRPAHPPPLTQAG